MPASVPTPAAIAPPPPFFHNYTEAPRLAPVWWWRVARWLTLCVTVGLITLLAVDGTHGLQVFWGIAIPIVPLLLVVAPGLWRQVCPMAFVNQMPRTLGFSLGRDLPERWRRAAFPIAVALFVGLVALRVPLLNQSPLVMAAGLSGVLVVAFLGGYVFKGRSGWCGTFCPLGPVQRTYGQAPLAVVPNGYCPTCVGCQKNCYDLNPRAAIFEDLYDDDPHHAWQRRLFMGLLPGLIAGFFLQGPHPDYSMWRYVATLLAACCASAGLYGLLVSFLGISPYRVAALFGAAALVVFYWFTGPGILHNLADLMHAQVPNWAVHLAHHTGILAGVLLLASSARSGLQRRQALTLKAAARPAAPGRRVVPIHAASSSSSSSDDSAASVTDRASGQQMNVAPGANLLETLRHAGLPINHSCHAGLCGSDAVAVCEGAQHLSPPDAVELATLRRLGLEGKARLACMCDVQGAVTIDRNPHAELTPSAAAPQTAAVDPAAAAGIGRVVVVGNGVAGMTAVEALRRASPSVEIHLVGDEPGRFYNRMALTQLITGLSQGNDLDLVDARWAQTQRVTVHSQVRATAIHRQRRELQLHRGGALAYDRLVLALGASAATPSADFARHSNAFVLRTAADAHAIRALALTQPEQHAIVIGGGVLGVEAALALSELGLTVQILERASRLMAGQLDIAGAARLSDYLARLGIASLSGVSVAQWEGSDTTLHAVSLVGHDTTTNNNTSGERLPADLFVACLGVVPHVRLAREAGLTAGPRGITVDTQLRSSDPSIYAVGDVADAQDGARLWPVAVAQAEAAVTAMLGRAPAEPAPQVVMRLKCNGLDVSSFGAITEAAGDAVWQADPGAATHWRVVWRGSEVVGGLVVGAPGSAKAFARALQAAPDRDAVRRALVALG